jgi:hypothetical protein
MLILSPVSIIGFAGGLLVRNFKSGINGANWIMDAKKKARAKDASGKKISKKRIKEIQKNHVTVGSHSETWVKRGWIGQLNTIYKRRQQGKRSREKGW